ncbi:hypothetical protein [Oceanobacillus massiliensis]|uniref:hypothetical protein n=1 Tax=Oceanobacillus massiliensis TaxID=1465765 RepID=UPI0030194532
MKKIWIWTAAILLVLCIIGAVFFFEEVDNIELKHTLNNNQNLEITADDGIQLAETYEQKYSFQVYDKVSKYKIGKKSNLTVTERVFPNADSFIFVELKNGSSEKEQVKLELGYHYANRYEVEDFSAYKVDRPHDSTVGVDKTTYPYGLLRFFDFEKHDADVMVGKNYISEMLEMDYDDGKHSYIRKLIREKEQVEVQKTKDKLSISLVMEADEGQISDQWMMLSEKNLFENEEELEQWIELSNKQFKHVNNWYTDEGVYNKLPWSVEPFDEMGYGKNLMYFREDLASKRYRVSSEERYYSNLMLNALINLEKYPQNSEGLFETHYTSTWLKEDYGITAPYVDTRQNEMAAITMNQLTDILDLESTIDQEIVYADFLVGQYQAGNVLKMPGGQKGYLISDYYDRGDGYTQTHTSLNHVLGEMNVLLEVYLRTNEDKYLDVAWNIKQALKETEDEWIRDDSDLWYQVDIEFKYSGRDYPIVTLRDLLDAEKLWMEVNQDQEYTFKKLLDSKVEYLQNENIEIEEELQAKMEEIGYAPM